LLKELEAYMARVQEFRGANVTRLLLSVVIVVGLILCVGIWVFYSPGRRAPIVQPAPSATVPK
jgi:hypothetical protein